eukprot:g12179.t1
MVDETLARYACWISSQAAIASGMEQKVTALSRRTAAEFRKAEGERQQLQRRLEVLEATCRTAMGRDRGERPGAGLNSCEHGPISHDEKLGATGSWQAKVSQSLEVQAMVVAEQQREELARRFQGLEEQVAKMSQESRRPVGRCSFFQKLQLEAKALAWPAPCGVMTHRQDG